MHVLAKLICQIWKKDVKNKMKYIFVKHFLDSIWHIEDLSVTWGWGRGASWSWSYGNWFYNYLCNQYLSPLTSGGVYSIQHYVIKFVSHLWQVGGFLRVLRFPPSPLFRAQTLGRIISRTCFLTMNVIYSETCLNWTSLGPTFVLRIDRFSLYTGYFNKDFLYWGLIYLQFGIYTGFWFIQRSVETGFIVTQKIITDLLWIWLNQPA